MAFGVSVLIAVVFLTNLGLDMARGLNFGTAALQSGAQTLEYLGRLARGDLGSSAAGVITGRSLPVAEVIATTLPRSLGLIGASLLAGTLVGCGLGFLAAVHRHRRASLMLLLFTIAGVSTPSFFAAFLLQQGAIRLGQVLGWRLLPVGGFGWDAHIILPALVLAARPIAQIARVTYVKASETLEQEFVRTAYSKGLSSYRVLVSHVFRNVAIPVLATLGVSLRFALSSLPIVEFFFSWPGVGFTLLKTIAQHDDNTAIALLLCLSGLLVAASLALELSYGFIDPRLLQSTKDDFSLGRRRSLAKWLRALVAAVASPLTKRRLVSGRRQTRTLPLTRQILQRYTPSKETDTAVGIPHRGRKLARLLLAAQRNPTLLAGALLLIALIGACLLGSRIAPHSPYTTQGLRIVDGEFSVPPFPPSDVHPWGTDLLGRDVLSLILTGAQRTLSLTALAVAVRLLIGFIAGALAGWWSGSWVDHALTRLSETVAAFPSLLLAMILILALGIRQGFRPFAIAIAFVGWGEIMTLVKGEIRSLRRRPFIESAIALGANTQHIIRKHMLPHLASLLVAITALEAGAVLLLLSELGFLGIFIGGGAFAELVIWAPPFHYSDVPEWGALLSSVRTYARSYPWMTFYPALAFFVTILGFNLLGEGLLRVLERRRAGISRLLKRCAFVSLLILLAVTILARWNLGEAAAYSRQAQEFSGDRAYAHVQTLASPEYNGRSLGTSGMAAAAEYIASAFEASGLQAAGKEFSFFYERFRAFQTLDTVPLLAIEGAEQQPVYRQDYVEYSGYYRNLGEATGRVRYLATGDLTSRYLPYRGGDVYPALDDVGIPADEILLVHSENVIRYLARVPCGGVLLITEDEADLERQLTLSPTDRSHVLSQGPSRPDIPVLRVSPTIADALLEGTGYTAAATQWMAEQLGKDEAFDLATVRSASISVEGTITEREPVQHVIGHLPGTAGVVPGATGSRVLDDQVILVLAQYDSPPPGPTSAFYAGADDNASAVAVMLEAVRAMQESGYQPYRTFLFVAYSGEGLEGGKNVSSPEAAEFLKAKYGFSTSLTIEAVVRIRAVGSQVQGSERLALWTEGSERLVRLFEGAGRRLGVRTQRMQEPIDLGFVYADMSAYESAQEAPEITLSRPRWEVLSHRPADALDIISADSLEQAGRTLTLALMIMGREPDY